MNFSSCSVPGVALLVLTYFIQLSLSFEGGNGNNGLIGSNHDITKKLRRYKICNGTRCKSIRSFTPPSVLFDMDSFLYSRWTRWAPCSRHCTTKRYRACKFPLVCGNTVLHEEAFCYHRGTHCEHIFENNQRDFLASSGGGGSGAEHGAEGDEEDAEYFEDYVDRINKEQQHLHPENNPMAPMTETFLVPSDATTSPGSKLPTTTMDGSGNARPMTMSMSPSIPSRSHPSSLQQQQQQQRPVRHPHPHRHGRNQGGFEYKPSAPGDQDKDGMFSGTVGPIPPAQDYMNNVDANYDTNYDEDQQTCGIARDMSPNSGMALRILGGRETKKGKWPWQVALMNRMQEVFCGGTLIAPRWVLSAAHCVRKNLRVVVGEHHLHKHDGTEKHYKVQAAFIHPNFDRETVDNDVALLLLPEPVPTAAGLACLPRENQPLPEPDTLCTILGWGKRNHTHVFGTTTLHEGRVPIVSNLECRFRYGAREITQNMFCAGYRRGTVDSCAGDSGGPILCTDQHRWTVFGVTSFGDGCGRKNKFGIYAKVPNYVSWIKKIMRANEFYG